MPSPTSLRRIALVQQAVGEDPARNLARAEEAIRSAAARGAQLVCLQELFRTPYFPQVEDAERFELAEPADTGPTSERMRKLAAELGVVIIAPIFERRAPGVYHNTALVIDADGSQSLYRKMHLPDDPGFYEKFYFAPGDLGFHASDTAAGRIGALICWDQWFPEAARLLALDGAEVLFYPTAIGWGAHETDAERAAQRDAWLIVQRGHAIANGVFVAAANRVGREGSLTFWGSSFVCDPQGRMLGQSPVDREDLLVVDLDLARIEQQRRGWPHLRDRRVDAYGDLLKLYRR